MLGKPLFKHLLSSVTEIFTRFYKPFTTEFVRLELKSWQDAKKRKWMVYVLFKLHGPISMLSPITFYPFFWEWAKNRFIKWTWIFWKKLVDTCELEGEMKIVLTHVASFSKALNYQRWNLTRSESEWYNNGCDSFWKPKRVQNGSKIVCIFTTGILSLHYNELRLRRSLLNPLQNCSIYRCWRPKYLRTGGQPSSVLSSKRVIGR